MLTKDYLLKFKAVSIRARCEYACGKFPKSLFDLKSISSLNNPR